MENHRIAQPGNISEIPTGLGFGPQPRRVPLAEHRNEQLRFRARQSWGCCDGVTSVVTSHRLLTPRPWGQPGGHNPRSATADLELPEPCEIRSMLTQVRDFPSRGRKRLQMELIPCPVGSTNSSSTESLFVYPSLALFAWISLAVPRGGSLGKPGRCWVFIYIILYQEIFLECVQKGPIPR